MRATSAPWWISSSSSCSTNAYRVALRVRTRDLTQRNPERVLGNQVEIALPDPVRALEARDRELYRRLRREIVGRGDLEPEPRAIALLREDVGDVSDPPGDRREGWRVRRPVAGVRHPRPVGLRSDRPHVRRGLPQVLVVGHPLDARPQPQPCPGGESEEFLLRVDQTSPGSPRTARRWSVGLVCGPPGTRTLNLRVKSPLLCQLS